MNTCKTCRHWLRAPPTRGTCNRIDWCEDVNASKDAPAHVNAGASDDDGMWAQLDTHASFGCTLHEKK